MGMYLRDPATQDNESYYGNMQIAFGANTAIFKGKNVSKAHIDFPCRNNSIWLDDELVMDRGQFLREELK
jgi:2,5-dihydroxypyridine 5,6-dioxygenase